MESEELEALLAIYCLPGECEVDGRKITVNLQIDTSNDEQICVEKCKVPVTVVFTLPNNYPKSLPEVSLFSEHLSRESVLDIKEKIQLTFVDIAGEPVLLAISSFIQDEARSYVDTDLAPSDEVYEQKSGDNNDTPTGIAVLHIDHMRTKNKYCRTLERWAEELQLCGKIVFYKHLILVLLQGNYDLIKDFIVRLKTTNIDVDSRGHACKEKMMKVLLQEMCHLTPNERFLDFQRLECQEESSLQQIFKSSNQDVWGCVLPLLKHNS